MQFQYTTFISQSIAFSNSAFAAQSTGLFQDFLNFFGFHYSIIEPYRICITIAHSAIKTIALHKYNK